MKKSIKKDRAEKEKIVHVVSLRRVAAVVKGGKNFAFSALVVAGDGKGNAAYATGKSREVSEAVRKATVKASARMEKISLKDGRTVHHDQEGKFGASRVQIRSAPLGTGVIAGGDMRAVFNALGVQDVVGKSLKGGTSHNIVAATFEALKKTHSPRFLANRRGCKVIDILGGKRHGAAS